MNMSLKGYICMNLGIILGMFIYTGLMIQLGIACSWLLFLLGVILSIGCGLIVGAYVETSLYKENL